jgi:DNA-binding response OmpR family regulator
MDSTLINKRVLVAEDEPAMLNALTDKFKREGCVVTGAADGEAALALAIKEKPDIILLDILMPKMDGMEVLSRVRNEAGWGKVVPVIILTNVPADEKIMNSIIKDTASYYLLKSDWKLYEVVERARNCFRNPTPISS